MVTKSELPDAEIVAELLSEETSGTVHLISAVTGQGLDDLLRIIVRALQEVDAE